jgi:hypothetical protein
VALSGLSLGTTYYWQIRSVNGTGTTYADGSSTAFWSFTTGNVPGSFSKSAPLNAATNVSTNPTLSWGTSSGATSYEYCYDTTNDNACSSWTSTGTTTNVALSGLSLGTTYYWQIRSVNGTGTTYADGSSTAFWSFTTGNVPGSFSKASPLNAATNISTNPTLSWGTSSGATSYEYCYDSTNDNACSSWTSTGTTANVALSGLSLGTTYYWQIRSVNGTGTTYADGSSTAFWSFTTGNVPGSFSKASPLNAATNVSTNPTLSWGTSTGATSYEYCYDTSNDNACSSWTSTGTTANVALSGLSLGTTYYWQIRSINGTGTTYADGSSTAFWSFTTGNVPGSFSKASPLNAATNISTNPTLSWGTSSGATSYEYCYDSTNDNACSSWTSTGTSANVALSGLSLGTTYYWQIRSVNGTGTTYAEGSSTAFWSFTTRYILIFIPITVK